MDALEVIDLHCPACGHLSRYPTVHVGKTVICPSCKHGHVLPPKPVGVGSGTQPATTAGHDSRTYGDTDAVGAGDKVLFICSACKYRARIPSQYVGMAVRCPSCDAAQIATPEEGAAAPTGRTVQISRMPSAAAPKGKTTVRPGNILFTCGLCNFEAQLAKHYVGKAIRCPGCHAPQVVVDSAGAADAPAAPPKDGEAPQPSDPRFICISCGYRARIPNQYMGLAVTCPKCDTVQIASPEDSEAPATGDTVKIAKLKTSEPVAPASRGPGEEKVSFACSACGFKAQFGKSLLGMAIKCPGCQATQVVGGAAVPGSISGGPPAVAPAQPASAASVLASAGGGDKVRFTCTACGFKARIPSHYAGQTIHCPGCNVVQLVLRSGQTSGAATGNTQVLSVVQTADEAATKPAASAPPQTPAFGNVAIAEPAAAKPGIDLDDLAGAMPGGIPTAKPAAKPAPAPAIAKPATAAVARPATPAVPVAPAAPAAPVAAKPAAPAAKPTPAEDPKQAATLPMASEDPLTFDTPPKGSEVQAGSSGKVVRRNSGRHSVAGSGKAATPLPEEGESAKPEPAKPAPAKPAAKPSAKPEPRAPASSPATPAASERKAPMPPEVQPVARTSPMLMVLLVVILLAMLGGMGFGGWQLVQIQNQLGEAQKQLSSANDKLTKAEKDAEKAKSEADQAKKAQEDEAAARKTADEKALALQKQIDEQKQAAEKQAAELQKKLDEQQKALDEQKAAPKDK